MTENPKKRKSLLSAAALALLLVVGTPSIALAQPDRQGAPVREAVVTSEETLPQTTATSEEDQMFTTTTSDQRGGPAHKKGGREKAQAKVEAMRAEKGTLISTEKREQACEKRKNGLETKFASIARNSESFQTRIDDIYAKALVYQTSSAITNAELTELVAAADEAKVNAAVSVAALLEVKPTTLDCKNVNVATDVASFKISAAQARDDLKDYKQAVKAVLKSLKTATVTAEETTEEEAVTETKPETEGTN